jgi:hypothetical protein
VASLAVIIPFYNPRFLSAFEFLRPEQRPFTRKAILPPPPAARPSRSFSPLNPMPLYIPAIIDKEILTCFMIFPRCGRPLISRPLHFILTAKAFFFSFFFFFFFILIPAEFYAK